MQAAYSKHSPGWAPWYQACEPSELRALGIEPPLRVDVLCQRLGERRGRPLRLVSSPTLPRARCAATPGRSARPAGLAVSLALIQALAAFAGLVWTLNQLRRAPRHRGLWLVSACLATAEAVYVLGLDPVAAAINATVAAGASKVPENVAVMVFHFLVIWFFLNAAGTPASRVHRQALIASWPRPPR